MEWDVVDVKVMPEFSLWVRFRDGVEGMIYCSPTFFRGVFAPLHDPLQFAAVTIVDGVLTWLEHLDLAPDAMHTEIKQHGYWQLE
ncbi:DUF2442 domain-containing protein [Rhodoferax sp. 4810]|uniref:DUF2442 domain-containing protein n=1 Tax=Thiospirillum jenense TaxID=1653858 RepID=A0A839HDZ0_9GAMM|nr:DUF2442 domain-containing protein [Thiospirillum jenense]MBB1073177.1 DUF2442 domain-containing protein [Rhodoferax jenense]MBB1124662.1 DUF2442 domain-containing protein [Thiospirillum jenense]